MSDLFDGIMEEVRAERARQDDLFGRQSHPFGTSIKFRAMAESARNSRQRATDAGTVTWMHILREGFWGAMSETSTDDMRAELVRLLAAGVACVEDLDQR